MRRKTRVLTPVFRQLSFSQLLSTVCRILPHCAHVADMNFFWVFWDTHQNRNPEIPVLINTSIFVISRIFKTFPARLFTYSLFKDEIVPFFVNRIKKGPDKIQMIFTSILRQALVVMITHTPIRSVRTFFLWKLTAMTDLQMGHLILMMPSTASGSASNNLLFLQHGQATCTSCISFRLPQEASQKGMSNWPLVIVLFFSALFAVT